jgi:hypothetical protein
LGGGVWSITSTLPYFNKKYVKNTPPQNGHTPNSKRHGNRNTAPTPYTFQRGVDWLSLAKAITNADRYSEKNVPQAPTIMRMIDDSASSIVCTEDNIVCTEDNRASLIIKTASKAHTQPKKSLAVIPMNKDFRRVESAIRKHAIDNFYRRDLEAAALGKWTKVYQGNRRAKGIKKTAVATKKGRGNL